MIRRSSAIWIFCLSASLILLAGCGTGSIPVPAITSLSPSSATAGAAAQTLTINGTGFILTSKVTYNGVAHAATLVSATQLTISLSTSDVATAGSFPVVVTNPPPGGASNAVNFTVTSSAVPTITSLSPSSVTAGAAAQTLTINGTGFLSTSTVTYNGVAHAATFVSATQLTISLSASDQATGGNFPVVVTNPAPGGGASNSVNFTVNNPAPSITLLSPSSVTAGAAAQTLTITGSNFLASSTVTYNGVAHTATFVSATQLTISLSVSDQAVVGTFPVVVTNPAPGGGASKSATFTVSSPILVSDSVNNRVLIYNAPFSSDESASVVLGQAGFTTATAALTAAGMSMPVDAVEDSAGNIYVSDQTNNRVLQFQPPFSNGMNASLVIGQPGFTTNAANTTQNGLNTPGGLAFDSGGNLWVVDFGNNRVLQYKPPFTTGMNANLVIGQANFTSNAAATTNSGLSGSFYIAFDASGDLWVTDAGNNRVLEFMAPLATNGMAASLVIGQTDFTSGGAASPPTAASLSGPAGIAFDGTGNLWIGDLFNNRVLEFKPAFANGMNASLVLGQTLFTTNTAATTASALSNPVGVAFDLLGNLWVADSANNRTLEFAPPFGDDQNATLVLGQANFTSGAAAAPPTATSQSSPSTARAAP